jgi:hypothetical protein
MKTVLRVVTAVFLLCSLSVATVHAGTYNYTLNMTDNDNVVAMCVLGVKPDNQPNVPIIQSCSSGTCTGSSDSVASKMYVTCSCRTYKIFPKSYRTDINPEKKNKIVNCTFSKTCEYMEECVNMSCTLVEQ